MKLNQAMSEPNAEVMECWNAGVMGCGTCTLDSILQFSTERSFLFLKAIGESGSNPHFSWICVARRSEQSCDKVGIVDDEVLGEYTLLEEETSQMLSQSLAKSRSRKSFRNGG